MRHLYFAALIFWVFAFTVAMINLEHFMPEKMDSRDSVVAGMGFLFLAVLLFLMFKYDRARAKHRAKKVMERAAHTLGRLKDTNELLRQGITRSDAERRLEDLHRQYHEHLQRRHLGPFDRQD